jgi:hypothetical protein
MSGNGTHPLQERYVDLLLDRISACDYPSTTMLDRAERAVLTRAQAENYVEALLRTVEHDDYPSPQMLDRISRLVRYL